MNFEVAEFAAPLATGTLTSRLSAIQEQYRNAQTLGKFERQTSGVLSALFQVHPVIQTVCELAYGSHSEISRFG
jgi:hypothetical protein